MGDGHTDRVTDEDDAVDVFLLHAGVLQRLFDGLEGVAGEVAAEFLELGTSGSFGELIAVLEGFDLELDGVGWEPFLP